MEYLHKIHDGFYSYFNRASNMLFTIKRDEAGVLCRGRCWYFHVTYNGQKHHIGNFVLVNDRAGLVKEGIGAKLWTDEAALREADIMIGRILEC